MRDVVEFTVEDVHHYKKKLEAYVKKIAIDPQIEKSNRKYILNFENFCLANGRSAGRTYKYMWVLKKFVVTLRNKKFKRMTREDLVSFINSIQASGKYGNRSVEEFKICLRLFYRYIYKLPQKEDAKQTSWIQIRKTEKDDKSSDILSPEEIQKMAQVATNERDRAILLLTYEVGARCSEILTAQIKHIEFDAYGGFITVQQSKTKPRKLRFVTSVEELKAWLNKHPFAADLNAPLFCSIGDRNRFQPLSYNAFSNILTQLAERANITKHVTPQTLRRSRATFLARHLSDAELKAMFAWTQGSKVSSKYVFLSGKDLDEKILEINGVKVAKSAKSKFGFQTCTKCSAKNKVSDKFCSNCGFTLDPEIASRIQAYDKMRAEVGGIMLNEMSKNSELRGKMKEISDMLELHERVTSEFSPEVVTPGGKFTWELSEQERQEIFGSGQLLKRDKTKP